MLIDKAQQYIVGVVLGTWLQRTFELCTGMLYDTDSMEEEELPDDEDEDMGGASKGTGDLSHAATHNLTIEGCRKRSLATLLSPTRPHFYTLAICTSSPCAN